MVMHRNDSVFESTSYYHRRFPGNCQLNFERCQKNITFLDEWLCGTKLGFQEQWALNLRQAPNGYLSMGYHDTKRHLSSCVLTV